MFVRVYIAKSVERHRGIALKTGGTETFLLRVFRDENSCGRRKKIDGYNTVIIARRAKTLIGGVRRKKLCVGEKTTGVNKTCAGLTVRCSAQVQPYLAPPAQKAVNAVCEEKSYMSEKRRQA